MYPGPGLSWSLDTTDGPGVLRPLRIRGISPPIFGCRIAWCEPGAILLRDGSRGRGIVGEKAEGEDEGGKRKGDPQEPDGIHVGWDG